LLLGLSHKQECIESRRERGKSVAFEHHPREKAPGTTVTDPCSFSRSALAEQFYVVFDPASHKCEAMHNIPDGMKSMGTYGSKEEAEKAMHGMKECG